MRISTLSNKKAYNIPVIDLFMLHISIYTNKYDKKILGQNHPVICKSAPAYLLEFCQKV